MQFLYFERVANDRTRVRVCKNVCYKFVVKREDPLDQIWCDEGHYHESKKEKLTAGKLRANLQKD